ncbi:MAG: heparin lyase I family protein [Dongiaceae bacterium]
MSDGFEGQLLDKSKWWDGQILASQYSIAAPGRCGLHAIKVTVADGITSDACDAECQRAEIRVASGHWPLYGDVSWYSFSFRVDGDLPTTGSDRTVIGQWKAPTDNSPFVAQRFDNSVFHITIQDADTRILVAKAEGDPGRVRLFEALVSSLSRNSLPAVEALEAIQAMWLLAKSAPAVLRPLELPDAALESLVSRLGVPPGLRDQLSARAIVGLIGEFSFLADIALYMGPSSATVERNEGATLPDPRKGWTDMKYRIRGGRQDNQWPPQQEGQLDVWANGNLVATVRGNLSYKSKSDSVGQGQYFKFGIYRKLIPGAINLYFDEFHQGSSEQQVKMSCP